jgi:energy-coupling factor transporter ATP-binding protein EcfA2
LGEINIRDLHYSYPPLTSGGEPVSVLRGVDLEVEKGEFVSVMGPTGVGKTTLCLALNGIVPQSMGGIFKGDVVVGGLNTKAHPVPKLASQVGVVFQDPESQFFNMNVEDEVAFGPESLGIAPAEIRERIAWALDVVHMSDLRGRSPFQLSGGQKQRVAIASILAMKPDILVLDEPTAGLDPLGKFEVFRAVQELRHRERITIVMVEQDAEKIAEFSDRVVVMREGRVALVDAPPIVFSQVDLMHEIGLAVPQVSELAACFNARSGTHYAFVSFGDAYDALAQNADCVGLAQSATVTDFSNPPSDPSSAIPILQATRQVSPPSPIVQVRDLWYQYTDDIVALRGVSLDIEDGDFVAVIGQNGSGKTTLVKHLNGLHKPTRGQVVVEGRDTKKLPVGELARSVGYVFQNPDYQIFCAAVREEIAFGPRNLGLKGDELEERVEEALAYFGLTEHADSPPAVLGFGARRKISVAAVYAMRPRIFVLDEPTTGLDWKSATGLMRAIQALNEKGHTIVLVTHDMKIVCEFARRSLVLREGRVLAYDDTRTVFEHSEMLLETQIAPPQITALAKRMGHLGMPDDVLTVDEFYTTYVNRQRGCSEFSI